MENVISETHTVGDLRVREEILPPRHSFGIPNFEDYIAYGAPCGGALAFVKNPAVHLMVGLDSSELIFETAYGDKIAQMDVRRWTDVKKMGWTLSEHFVVVFGDTSSTFSEHKSSKVEVYTITQELFMSYAVPAV